MNPSLTDFHRILFLDLMPWQIGDWPVAKFKELNHRLVRVLPAVQPFFKVELGKALSPKRAYFYSIIDSASNKYLNEIFEIHGVLTKTNEFKYWAHRELTKSLAAKLTDIENIISKRNLQLEGLNPNLKSQNDDADHQDEIFIIQALKQHLIRLYLEVQELFKDHLSEPFRTEEDLHNIFFSELKPEAVFIHPSEPLVKADPGKIEVVPEIVFEPKSFDFHQPPKGVLLFGAVVKNPSRFANFERLMFANGLITDQYSFIQQKGILTLFAAIYRLLISKGYFNQHLFPGRKPIKPIAFQKFLDHRYNIKTEQQFRSYNKKPELWIAITEKYAWLENLPPS